MKFWILEVSSIEKIAVAQLQYRLWAQVLCL